MTRLLIVSPAYNEEKALPEFVRAVQELRASLRPGVEIRLMVVDDGSLDRTADVLRTTADAHPEWFGFVRLASNAGHQAALLAGLCHAGEWPDAIVTMDADLEHPIDVVPRLIKAWQDTGAVVVHAIRRPARELSLLKRLPSSLFYRLAAALTGLNLTAGQADFRLWDAAVLLGVRPYLPHLGSLRVFAAWLPGQKAAIEYDQTVRADRTSRFTFRKNLDFAVTSIVRFSHRPLQAITWLGMLGLFFSVVYGIFIAVESSRGYTVPGWSSTVLTVMAMGCLQLLAIGILASYFRRLVFAQDLPPWVVKGTRLPAERAPDGR